MSAHEIARQLLSIQAILLQPHQPFTWSSGLRSPIYCDNRLTMSYPHVREMIADGLVEMIRSEFSDAEVIAGAATGGIPHAAWVADRLKLPMVYVRDKAKGHGRQNRVEGFLPSGAKVVVIEDTISTGGSALKAAEGVADEGGEVIGVAAIFSYQFDRATKAFAAANIKLKVLSHYAALIEAALESGAIKDKDVALLQSWRVNPEGFGG